MLLKKKENFFYEYVYCLFIHNDAFWYFLSGNIENVCFSLYICLYPLNLVSGKATIQARTIILEVARVLSAHKWRFAINVNFNGSTDSFFFQVMNNAIKNKGFVLLLLFCPQQNQDSFGYWNLRSVEVNLSSQLLILSIHKSVCWCFPVNVNCVYILK